jgi:hypothetical protein
MAVSPQELAEQLTLIDFAIYSNIEVPTPATRITHARTHALLTASDWLLQPSELLNQSWNSTKLAYRAPNVRAMINRANSVSFWVANMILLQEKAKDRKKVSEKFIQLAEVPCPVQLLFLLQRITHAQCPCVFACPPQCLRKINNFNTLMGIIAGLNTASVNRLKAIKTDMSKKLLSVRAPQSSPTLRWPPSDHYVANSSIVVIRLALTRSVVPKDGNADAPAKRVQELPRESSRGQPALHSLSVWPSRSPPLTSA